MTEYHTPEVLVLDFDRTLGDVDRIMNRVYESAAAIGLDPNPIRHLRDQSEGKQPFAPLDYIRERVDSVRFKSFKDHFVHGTGKSGSILYPDAERFMQRLTAHNIPHTILTYGVDETWQSLKVMAAGYPVSYMVTSTQDKGPIIASFQGADGVFAMHDPREISLYKSDRLVFIDDKASAFDSFPQTEGYHGLWLQRSSLLDSQKGSVPANVSVISSLDKVELAAEQESLTTKTDLPTIYIPLSDHVIVIPADAESSSNTTTRNRLIVRLGQRTTGQR